MLDRSTSRYQEVVVPDATPSDEKKKLLEAEVERLRAELGVLEQQWKKRYWLALFGLFAIPGFYFFGLPALALGVLGTPALVATQSYLLAVRRAECEQLIEESRRALLRLARARDAAALPKPA